MEPAGGRRIDQRNTTNLELLGEANLDLLVDALSLYYCHSLGVRKIGEQRQTNGSHKDTERVQRIILCRSLKKSAVSPAEFIRDRKEGCRVSNRVSIGRRVVLLLAMVLVAATLATMSAASASADELSDSQLRHKINVIQNRPGPLTNQEETHIDNLKDRIQDNDDDDDDDD